MTFAEKLKEKRKVAIQEKVKEFAEELKPTLEESAEKGYRGWKIKVSELDMTEKALVYDPDFISELKKHLTGMEVEITTETYRNILLNRDFQEKYLSIRWG